MYCFTLTHNALFQEMKFIWIQKTIWKNTLFVKTELCIKEMAQDLTLKGGISDR